MGETPPFSPDRVPWREAFALPICLSGRAPAESGIAVRVRSAIKPYALWCIFICPSAIKTRNDDKRIVVSSVSEALGERESRPLIATALRGPVAATGPPQADTGLLLQVGGDLRSTPRQWGRP